MTTTTTDQVAVDLDTAADVLRERGWSVGTIEDDHGRVCVAGAICIAVAGRTSRTHNIAPALFRTRIEPAKLAVEIHLDLPHPHVPGARMNIETWNDIRAESAEEVAELLERVAAERAAEAP